MDTKRAPEWAERQAERLAQLDPNGMTVFGYRNAFAQYIAAHEDPPVDPVLLEAREIYGREWAGAGTIQHSGAMSGSCDSSTVMQCILAALKRGIEIGKSHA